MPQSATKGKARSMTVVQALTELTNDSAYRVVKKLDALAESLADCAARLHGNDAREELADLPIREFRARIAALDGAWQEYHANRVALGEAVKAERRRAMAAHQTR